MTWDGLVYEEELQATACPELADGRNPSVACPYSPRMNFAIFMIMPVRYASTQRLQPSKGESKWLAIQADDRFGCLC